MSKKNYKSIADELLSEKDAAPHAAAFVDALSQYDMLSILGTRYIKKMEDQSKKSQSQPYTVFVPKEISLPTSKEDAIRYLKCHIVKNAFDEDTVRKYCTNPNLESDGSGTKYLKLSTLGKSTLIIKCDEKMEITTEDGKKTYMKKTKMCSNGTYYLIDSPLSIQLDSLPPMKVSTKEHKPAMIDLLFKNKATKPFVMACAKYDLSSLLCSKFYDKKHKQYVDYTVFAPKKLTLSEDSETNLRILRSHFGKRNFDAPNIKKFCASNGIEALTIGTMSDVKIKLDCNSNFLKIDDNSEELKLSEPIKASNGIIYIIKQSLL